MSPDPAAVEEATSAVEQSPAGGAPPPSLPPDPDCAPPDRYPEEQTDGALLLVISECRPPLLVLGLKSGLGACSVGRIPASPAMKSSSLGLFRFI